jgi:hypothetical protein
MTSEFPIIKNNVIHLDAKGIGSVVFKNSDFIIPKEYFNFVGTLSELIKKVLPSNVTLHYYVQAIGELPPNFCSGGQRTLYANLSHLTNIPGSKQADIPLYVVNYLPNKIKINTDWIAAGYGNGDFMITSLKVFSQCIGLGCNCDYSVTGGWHNITINLKIEVEINLNNPFCITNPLECINKKSLTDEIISPPQVVDFKETYDNFIYGERSVPYADDEDEDENRSIWSIVNKECHSCQNRTEDNWEKGNNNGREIENGEKEKKGDKSRGEKRREKEKKGEKEKRGDKSRGEKEKKGEKEKRGDKSRGEKEKRGEEENENENEQKENGGNEVERETGVNPTNDPDNDNKNNEIDITNNVQIPKGINYRSLRNRLYWDDHRYAIIWTIIIVIILIIIIVLLCVYGGTRHHRYAINNRGTCYQNI